METQGAGFFEKMNSLVINPVVVRDVAELGFLTPEGGTTENDLLMRQFDSHYAQTYANVRDQEKGIGMINDSERANLPKPECKIVERDGNKYFQIQIDPDTILITHTKPVEQLFNGFYLFSGLQVTNFLARGKDGTYIDLRSLAPSNTDTFFTFAAEQTGFEEPTTYDMGGNSIHHYGARIFLGAETKSDSEGKISWDTPGLKYAMLHEIGHAYQTDNDPSIKVAVSERNASAIALALNRKIVEKYPNANYFNKEGMKEYYERNLKDTYDLFTLGKTPNWQELTLEDIASQENRGKFRRAFLSNNKPE